MKEHRPTEGENIEDIWPYILGDLPTASGFYMRFALGNGTAFNIGVFRVDEDDNDALLIAIIDKGAYTFSRFVHWTYAREKLNLLEWDAMNIADFINRQLGLTGKPQGKYMKVCQKEADKS